MVAQRTCTEAAFPASAVQCACHVNGESRENVLVSALLAILTPTNPAERASDYFLLVRLPAHDVTRRVGVLPIAAKAAARDNRIERAAPAPRPLPRSSNSNTAFRMPSTNRGPRKYPRSAD